MFGSGMCMYAYKGDFPACGSAHARNGRGGCRHNDAVNATEYPAVRILPRGALTKNMFE